MASHTFPPWCPMCPSPTDSTGTAVQFEPLLTEGSGSRHWPTPYWRRSPDAAYLLSAPCLAYAFACTAGILFDRYFSPAAAWCLFAAVIAFAAWLFTLLGKRSVLQVGYLCLILAALGSLHHHFAVADDGPLDVCRLGEERSRPIQARGVLDQEPIQVQQNAQDELRTQP